MKITLNNFLLNDESTQFYLDGEITGLSIPEIRTSLGVYSGRNGGYVGAQFLGMRSITLTGTAFGEDIVTLEQMRRDIQEALRVGDVEMLIETNGGENYIIDCNLMRFDMPIKRTVNIAPFKIELLAPDPLIYDNTNGGVLSALINKVVGGGYDTPVVYPVIWAAGKQPTTVNNGGEATIYPIITLTGSATNPSIQNTTLGTTFKLENLVMSGGDVLVIDMKNRTVLLNGGSVFDKVSDDSTWWGLIAGDNGMMLDSESGSDTVSATIEWRSGYYGI